LIAASSVFNAIELQVGRFAYPPQGALYKVNGHSMHLNCMGSGAPTIILDSGYGNDALTWAKVQPELAKATRVCSYDRAGSGWSEPQPGPRDADHIAGQLHELIHQAGINGPIVLMGHSIAGLYVRAYASQYPADMAGIVFVDGSSPAQFDNPIFKAELGKGPPWLLIRVAAIAGFPRLLWTCSQPMPGWLDGHADRVEAEDVFHTHVESLEDEMARFSQSGRQTSHTGPYGALPILIFTQDTNFTSTLGMAEFAAPWNEMQENLKKLSTRSRRIIAKGSDHYIHVDRSDLIEKEVPLFIEQIRGTSPEPSHYGFTVTE
jgi:pimeloyl-ACP methyl ester carboxylesterase